MDIEMMNLMECSFACPISRRANSRGRKKLVESSIAFEERKPREPARRCVHAHDV